MAEPAFSRSQPLTEDEAYRWNQENAQLPVDRPWPTMFAGDGVSGYFGVPAEQSNGMVGDFVSGVMNAHPLSLAYRATQNAPDIAMAISDLSKRWRSDPQQMNPFRPGSDVREGIIGGANGAWNFATLPYQAFKHGMDSLEHGEGIASPSVTNDAIMAGLPSPAMGLVPGLGNGVATKAFANAPKATVPLSALAQSLKDTKGTPEFEAALNNVLAQKLDKASMVEIATEVYGAKPLGTSQADLIATMRKLHDVDLRTSAHLARQGGRSAFANAPESASPLAALLAGNAKTELPMDQASNPVPTSVLSALLAARDNR